ncbi:MAG: hypothetical protein EA360_10825 [Balneolaceae bacterium]|nr:MAG: hypothetical protein EA360_10825 [Balneolaceae bacterium]
MRSIQNGVSYDFLIVGSGFGGSVLAACLKQAGKKVLMIERGTHPRFAVGESSTPIADMILRELADTYSLPYLNRISRYGEWQRSYPDVICGLKRGFSYYKHEKGKIFRGDEDHTRECLVAASMDDENSDTNWLRSDVDHFLVEKAVESGVDYLEQAEIRKLTRNEAESAWIANISLKDQELTVTCNWIVDATGSPAFSRRYFGTEVQSDFFKTDSEALFTHFDGAQRWDSRLQEKGCIITDYPYRPDDSALHQLIDEGWIWMLRFRTGLLSAGLVLDRNRNLYDGSLPESFWRQVISSYPSLQELFEEASVSDQPGTFLTTGRLQRRLNRVWGEGWVAMNHTAGFVDPLHSTGIAFTLSGIEKLLKIFTGDLDREKTDAGFRQYEHSLFRELEFIDTLVACCYAAGTHFRLFTASVMLYFAATVLYEQSRLRGEKPDYFLNADHSGLTGITLETYCDLKAIGSNPSDDQIEKLTEKIRERIRPFNSAGLMDPEKKNIYRHTAVVL